MDSFMQADNEKRKLKINNFGVLTSFFLFAICVF